VRVALFLREGGLIRSEYSDPYELYLEGEWTWDMMEQIGRAVMRDTDGDGEIDQYGIGDMGWHQTIGFWVPSNGTSTVKIEDGKYVFNLTDEAALWVLQKLSDWRNIDRLVSDTSDHMYTGHQAFYAHTATQFRKVQEQTGDTSDIRIVPMPKGPNATEYVYPVRGSHSWLLPSNSEAPAALIQLIDFLSPPEEYERNVARWISAIATDRNSMELLRHAHQTYGGQALDFERVLEDVVKPAVRSVESGEKTAVTAISEIAQQAQLLLDETLGQF